MPICMGSVQLVAVAVQSKVESSPIPTGDGDETLDRRRPRTPNLRWGRSSAILGLAPRPAIDTRASARVQNQRTHAPNRLTRTSASTRAGGAHSPLDHQRIRAQGHDGRTRRATQSGRPGRAGTRTRRQGPVACACRCSERRTHGRAESQKAWAWRAALRVHGPHRMHASGDLGAYSTIGRSAHRWRAMS